MDTTKIYGYIATLKTGYCDTLDEYKKVVMMAEIDFRACFTQFMTETEGKGANLCLSDLMDLKKVVSAAVKDGPNNPLYEQFVYSLEKINEAIKYIKKTIKLYISGEIPQEDGGEVVMKRTNKVVDERVISGTEGLKDFLGCGKSLAFAIIKSRILVENGIQYKVGNCWKFNAKKLEEFLQIHPQFLENIHCIR